MLTQAEFIEKSVDEFREIDYVFLKSIRGNHLQAIITPTLEDIAAMRAPFDKFIDDFCEREFSDVNSSSRSNGGNREGDRGGAGEDAP